ncbi:hypothetical protein DH2020_018928 [Rehmannia glutinosa]|uniref:Uncharacterized protein n=1 Tax=Rehmannia glutinosa TaxID=99300 RepID=A0ABR0WM86_REHGL
MGKAGAFQTARENFKTFTVKIFSRPRRFPEATTAELDGERAAWTTWMESVVAVLIGGEGLAWSGGNLDVVARWKRSEPAMVAPFSHWQDDGLAVVHARQAAIRSIMNMRMKLGTPVRDHMLALIAHSSIPEFRTQPTQFEFTFLPPLVVGSSGRQTEAPPTRSPIPRRKEIMFPLFGHLQVFEDENEEHREQELVGEQEPIPIIQEPPPG